MEVIKHFRGEYAFMSNYAPSEVEYDGHIYHSAEAAFQAAKIDPKHPKAEIFKKAFRHFSPNEAKAFGKIMPLNPEWEKIKSFVMLEICRNKFKNEPFRQLLLDTENTQIVEGNCWHDNVWGVCLCDRCSKIDGQNRLGLILMKIRQELRTSGTIEE